MLDRRTVLGKAEAILDAFTVEEPHLSLVELVDRTGLPKGTVHRVASDLLTWGLLERTAGQYRLGLRMFELGLRVPRQRVLRDAALPFMEDLYEATREVVHLGIRDGQEVLYLEKLMGHRRVSAPSRVAGRMPLHCTGLGKALLAFSSTDIVDGMIEEGLQRRTPHTIVTPSVLRAQLNQVRETWLAYEHEESSLGLGCVAAPVFGTGNRLVAAISVAAPSSRYSPKTLASAVLSSTRGLSRVLGARV
jgi:DNA-binding IclR family transcriptional regulator